MIALIKRFGLVIYFLGCVGTSASAEKTQPEATTIPQTTIEQPNPSMAARTFDAVWEQLNSFHFDRTFNGHDWKEVRAKYRPRAEMTTNADSLRPVLQEMLNLLGQSHMSVFPGDVADRINSESDSAEGDAEPGIEVRFWNEKFLITSVQNDSPAQAAGLKAGFLLESVAGREISDFLKELPSTASPTHRELFAWKYIQANLKGPEDSEVDLTCLTPQGTREFKVKRAAPRGQTVKLGSFPEITSYLESKKISGPDGTTLGYIHFNFWMLPTALRFNQAIDDLRACDGIVIDLRGNLGGLAGMVMGVAGHFFTNSVSFGTMKMRDNELHFRITPRLIDSQGEKVQPYTRPVAILVDGMSVSASELFAYGMQETGRAKIFGTQTSGQALPSVTEVLPNGDVFYHPFADFISAKGIRIEGKGVKPDQLLPYSREVLLSGRDASLEAALQWLGQTGTRLSPVPR